MKRSRHRVVTSPTLRRLLLSCETRCSADCCKADAFDITERAVTHWLDDERIDRSRELAREIAALRVDAQSYEGHVLLAVRDLESDWEASDFRSFWDRFEAAFTSALAARRPKDS